MTTIRVDEGPITTVTLNRPEVRNALDDAMTAELSAWAATIRPDGRVRAVVLAGAGPVFCAGADLRWMAGMIDFSREENLADARRLGRLLYALDSLPVPLIGRVQGAALGAGAGFAAVCDTVVAAEDAVFGFPETTLGLVPAVVGPYVIRKIGVSAARNCFLDGARFGAAEAARIGLVHDVVHATDLDAAVARRAARFERTSPEAVAAGKQLIGAIAHHAPADMLAATADAIATRRISPDAQKRMREFVEGVVSVFHKSGGPGARSPEGGQGE